MTTCARTSFVILSGLVILACITPARPAVAMEWSDAMVLNINAESDGNVGDYYPRLATDGHGNWVVVWDAYNHFIFSWGSDHDLIFMRSDDDAVTWSAPAVLNSHALIDGAARDEKPMIEATPNWLWLNVWFSTYDLGGTIGSERDLLYATSCVPTHDGDHDCDGDVDLDDYAVFRGCLTGPEGGIDPVCGLADLDGDSDVDLSDFGIFQYAFTGPS